MQDLTILEDVQSTEKHIKELAESNKMIESKIDESDKMIDESRRKIVTTEETLDQQTSRLRAFRQQFSVFQINHDAVITQVWFFNDINVCHLYYG